MIDDATFMKAYQIVIDSLAAKCAFGYFEPDDIAQDIYLLCRDALSRFADDKATGRTPEARLANFFFIHCRNKLAHKKRNLFHRADPPCLKCASGEMCQPGGCDRYNEWKDRNAAKSSLCQAGMGGEGIPILRESQQAEDTELVRLIDDKLPQQYRSDWLRLRAGARFTKGRRQELIKVILSILGDYQHGC